MYQRALSKKNHWALWHYAWNFKALFFSGHLDTCLDMSNCLFQDTELEIFGQIFALDTWTLGHSVWNCQGLLFTSDTWTLTLKFSGSFFLWTLGCLDTGPELKFLDSFLHWTLGHSVSNCQGLFFTLDTWTQTMKFSGCFFLWTL